jgi:60 kDa SS-A/Ro ribonucleoprotein
MSGSGLKGSLIWKPKKEVVDALDKAFYMSFCTIEPTNKKYMLAIDVSDSMTWKNLNNIPKFTPRVAAAVMALVTKSVEPNCTIVGFSHDIVELDIKCTDTLNDVLKKIDKLDMGSTNHSSVIKFADRKALDVDVFVTYTDSEVNGGSHACLALKEYRKKFKKPRSKLAVVAMESNGFSIADPTDLDMMDFVGFDTATPSAISAFSVM